MPITQDLRGSKLLLLGAETPGSTRLKAWSNSQAKQTDHSYSTNKPCSIQDTCLIPDPDSTLGLSWRGRTGLSAPGSGSSKSSCSSSFLRGAGMVGIDKEGVQQRYTDRGEERIETFSYKLGKCVPWAALNMQTFPSVHSSFLAHIVHSSPWHLSFLPWSTPLVPACLGNTVPRGFQVYFC